MGQKVSQHQGDYAFTVNGREPHPLSHKTNYIRTTKYTILTFLPLNLFGQFRRFYNLYFLLGAILTLLPLGVAPISPFTQVVPLVLVLAVTALKDLYEDIGRYKSDQRANNVEFEVVNGGESKVVKSKDLRLGDVVRIEKNQQFPADVILFSSSQEDGIAYIETAELDGETNLKKRQALHETNPLNTKQVFASFHAKVECDPPDEFLYKFRGRMSVDQNVYALGPDQLLLRGAILRNTNFIYGTICYVGHDTKIMKNLKSSSLKFSSLDGRLNRLVLAIFVFNAILLLISAIISGAWQYMYGLNSFYIDWSDSPEDVGAYHAMTYYILYTYLIPISLFVTIEMSRVAQVAFMFWDAGMESESGIPMRPRNSNLNEDLGRISHIFSDKTGTLTQNIMKLRRWFVNGRIIEEDDSGAIQPFAKGEGIEADEKQIFDLFLRGISLCHTVVPAVDDKTGDIYYEGDSPDEAALLDALRSNDIVFTERTRNGLTINFMGFMEQYELLNVIEFTSSRKRMSVIVRTPDNQIQLFCKGADNVILERTSKKMDRDVLELLNTAISDFSREGLRTLLVANLPLTEEAYETFRKEYQEALTSIEGREEKLEAVAEKIERDLMVLGATAVEDKLQEDVAETIEYLIKCGIHIWMLTGDKLETAISIGKSTRFLTEDMDLMVV